jgi:hypothetical protein
MSSVTMLFVGLVTAQPALFAPATSDGFEISTLGLQSERPTCPLPDVRYGEVAWIGRFGCGVPLVQSTNHSKDERHARSSSFLSFSLHRHQRLRAQRVIAKGIRQRCAATTALVMAYSDWRRQKMDSLLIHGRPFEDPGEKQGLERNRPSCVVHISNRQANVSRR